MTEAPTETTTSADAAPDADDLSAAQKINRAVGKAAGLMHSEHRLSTGDLAELRRIAPEKPFTPALWKVLHEIGQHEAPGWMSQSEWERRWATQLMGMAFCVSPARSLHAYEKPLGSALLEAGWSELRFVRLLRAEGKALEVAIRRVAQYLASKAQPANWADVARLLFYQTGEAGERIRLATARRYYGALHAQKNDS